MLIKLLKFLHMKSHQEIQEELRNQEKWQILVSKQAVVCQELILKVLSAELWNKMKLVQLSDIKWCIICLTSFFAIIVSLNFHIQNHIWTNFEVWEIYYEIPFSVTGIWFWMSAALREKTVVDPLYSSASPSVVASACIGVSSKIGIFQRDWTTYLLALQQSK